MILKYVKNSCLKKILFQSNLMSLEFGNDLWKMTQFFSQSVFHKQHFYQYAII